MSDSKRVEATPETEQGDPTPSAEREEGSSPVTAEISSRPPGPLALLAVAAWSGMAIGAIELANLLAHDPEWHIDRLFGKNRHYPWIIPLVHVILFFIAAAPCAVLGLVARRLAFRLGTFVIGTMAALPILLIFTGALHDAAVLLLGMGIASLVVPTVRNRGRLLGRFMKISAVPILGAIVWAAIIQVPRDGAPEPRPTGAESSGPNLLLLVLDTVRADGLRLYGQDLPTPEMEALADQGVLFEQARATAPWTLPSHASMFTGRWPHETSVAWYLPLDDTHPTLAEILYQAGYDTAGFVGNTNYCSYSSGLDRGFAHYKDLPVTPLTALLATRLGTRLIGQYDYVRDRLGITTMADRRRARKRTADKVNAEFLHWLDRRDSSRPFFVFLNYFDAHDPYLVPEGFDPALGHPPLTPADEQLLADWWPTPDKDELPPEKIEVVRNAYDACIAYIDVQIGQLLGELERRGLRENTVIVVTSDHGELLGEHDLFGHGASLFEPEIRIPLLISGSDIEARRRVVEESVTLRDLAATLLDLAGLQPQPRVPGNSWRPLWERSEVSEGEEQTPERPASSPPALAEIDEPSGHNANHGRSPVFRGPMKSIVTDRLIKYIEILGHSIEVYDLRNDPEEQNNLATSPAARPLIEQLQRDMQGIFEPSSAPSVR